MLIIIKTIEGQYNIEFLVVNEISFFFFVSEELGHLLFDSFDEVLLNENCLL